MPSTVARLLAERGGIGVRSGCHCAHLTVKRLLGISPTLEQFQGVMLTVFRRLELPGVVRMSLGIENTAQDVDRLLQVLAGIVRSPKAEAGQARQMDEFAAAAAERVY